ncbi:DUF2459 domain-containing protein [Thermodesulfobacteriota bacterium]
MKNQHYIYAIGKDRIRKSFYLVCLFIIIFLFTSCVPNVRKQMLNTADQVRSNIIYYIQYETHSGIIIDRQRAAPYLTVFQKEFPDVRYLEIGWGDLKWYKTDIKKRGVLLMFRALFVPTSSGICVWSLPKHPDQQYPYSKLTKINVSDTEFQKLIGEINSSFVLDKENKIIIEKSSMDRGGEYRIYKARGVYHVFKNCNNWVDRILDESGINPG